jgi:hypothetical protein
METMRMNSAKHVAGNRGQFPERFALIFLEHNVQRPTLHGFQSIDEFRGNPGDVNVRATNFIITLRQLRDVLIDESFIKIHRIITFLS